MTVGSMGVVGLDWVEGYRPKPCCYVGVDVGQKVDPTALAVVEVGALEVGDGDEARRFARYIVRHAERLALGTPYPDVARRVVEVLEGIKARGAYVSRVFVDATGVGQPVVDLLAAETTAETFVSCYFTHGDKMAEPSWGTRTVGKAWLVSRLQVLLQSGRLQFPASLAERDALVRELLDYEIRVSEDADLRAGAFKVGSHDDLVTALGLACQDESTYRVGPLLPPYGGERRPGLLHVEL